MPRQNRVTPRGDLLAVPDRGTYWGNRGVLHDRRQRLVRYSSGRSWAICELDFKGRRRPLWAPRALTELFFLDEATGLAAGHRPCGECRYPAYRDFKAAWATLHPGDKASAPAIDETLHEDRLVDGAPVKRTFVDELGTLPAGSVVELDEQPWLVLGADLLRWTPGGYRDRCRRGSGPATVLTPRTTVEILRLGYRPVLHPSADAR